MADLKTYTPKQLSETYWGDVDPSEEWGSYMKSIVGRTNIAPSKCDLLYFVTRSSAAAIRSYAERGMYGKRFNYENVLFVVVPPASLTNEQMEDAITETRPRGFSIDPDAPCPEFRKTIAAFTVGSYLLDDMPISMLHKIEESAREKGYTL
jgi:hypothetical protein